MVVAWVPLLLVVVGILVYVLSDKNPKLAEVGKILLLAGALAGAFAMSRMVVHLGS